MAYIKTLKDNELVGGTDNTDVYPVTTTQAIYSQMPDGTVPSGIKHQRLEERLKDHEDDAKELHRKSEKLMVYLNNSKAGQILEITGETYTMTLTGSAQVESFGDEPSQSIAESEMDAKRMMVTSSGATLYDEAVADATYTLPNVVGSYTARFYCTYNGITKYATNAVNVNLRKYFGFASEQPEDVTTLGASHFSNSVAGVTVTIPASGTGFKKIWFAVPNGMSISRVVQPDALNAPLAITLVGTVERIIGGNSYTYKLYQSVDLIDSSISKRLTIN